MVVDSELARVPRGVHRIQIAPMLDVSYQDFRCFMRLLTKRAQIWSEMVVDQILVHNADNMKVLDEHLEFSMKEEPMVLQLGGSDPAKLAAATRIAYDYGYREEINLNAGCPSCRVAGKGEFGAALMKKPVIIQECLQAMAYAAPVPISLKTRLGVDDLDSREFFDSFVDTILSTPLPSSANFSLTVHARKAWLNGLSPAQNRSIPPLDYERAFSVCGSKPGLSRWYLNGGIGTLEEARDLLSKGPSNLEGIMMGRAAMNTPCEFATVDTHMYNEDVNPVSAMSRRTLLESYADYLHDKYPVDLEIAPGRIFMALKPTLSVFHGHRGNRQWRVTLDHLCRDTKLRSEIGPSGILIEALKSVEEDVLDLRLTE